MKELTNVMQDTDNVHSKKLLPVYRVAQKNSPHLCNFTAWLRYLHFMRRDWKITVYKRYAGRQYSVQHYTMSRIIQSHFYFYDNFGKCGPTSTVLSLLHLMVNCRKGRSKRCHLTSHPMPHYMFDCTTFIYDSHSTQVQTLITYQCYKFNSSFDQLIYF